MEPFEGSAITYGDAMIRSRPGNKKHANQERVDQHEAEVVWLDRALAVRLRPAPPESAEPVSEYCSPDVEPYPEWFARVEKLRSSSRETDWPVPFEQYTAYVKGFTMKRFMLGTSSFKAKVSSSHKELLEATNLPPFPCEDYGLFAQDLNEGQRNALNKIQEKREAINRFTKRCCELHAIILEGTLDQSPLVPRREDLYWRPYFDRVFSLQHPGITPLVLDYEAFFEFGVVNGMWMRDNPPPKEGPKAAQYLSEAVTARAAGLSSQLNGINTEVLKSLEIAFQSPVWPSNTFGRVWRFVRNAETWVSSFANELDDLAATARADLSQHNLATTISNTTQVFNQLSTIELESLELNDLRGSLRLQRDAIEAFDDELYRCLFTAVEYVQDGAFELAAERIGGLGQVKTARRIIAAMSELKRLVDMPE